MYEVRWIKIVIALGVLGGFIGHFIVQNIELGLVIGAATGSILKSYHMQKHTSENNI